MLHLAAESALDDLLATWRAHENRRTQVATKTISLADLAASRLALDKARNRMHRLRVALYPEGEEVEAVVESVWCETLETVIHLRWADRDQIRPGNFQCPCGHLVPVDWNR